MNFKEITKDVFYTGVNDRVTQKFESLWPIPNGISYNSYIVKGREKLALIDCVSIDYVHSFLANIQAIAPDKNIDYLVVNHMEPDHSGSIPEIVSRYPDIKIVGNSKTIEMIKGFYHIDDSERFHEVKDNDSIDLGGHELKFYLTPMVHWPETMMTWLADSKILFSGDAFGTYGALDGGIVDTEMNTDRYFPEMYRYYSNIVGKYGKFVQKALEKLAPLGTPEYICSTHGPVWHERINEVMEITYRLSKYESEPGVTIIYGSMYGNTTEVAEVIARELCAKGVRNIRVYNAAYASMSDMISDAFRYEGLIVGSATYSMGLFPEVQAFMDAMETREIKNKTFACFGGYTWAKNVVLAKLQDYAARMGLNVTASHVMKQTLSDESFAEAKGFANDFYNSLTLK